MPRSGVILPDIRKVFPYVAWNRAYTDGNVFVLCKDVPEYLNKGNWRSTHLLSGASVR